jgi:hypothetical protein
MFAPAKPPRRGERKTVFNPGNPTADLTDLIYDLGAETILAACIIRQAIDDWRDARAGKRFNRDNPYAADPLGELRGFFDSDWFAHICYGIGQTPDNVLRMARVGE